MSNPNIPDEIATHVEVKLALAAIARMRGGGVPAAIRAQEDAAREVVAAVQHSRTPLVSARAALIKLVLVRDAGVTLAELTARADASAEMAAA